MQTETSMDAVDAAPERRPGVPMENDPPHKMPTAHWDKPEQQPLTVPILMHGGRKELPPVFGTAVPPRLLSGALRKFAYAYPDHWARHWLTMLLADRVDIWEHRLQRFGGPALVAVAAAGGLLAARRARA